MGSPSARNSTDTRPPHRWGWWLRIAILLAWGGLYAHHASDHLLLSLGLVEQRDVASIITGHLRHRYRYDVLDSQGAGIGSVFIEYNFVDSMYESNIVLDLDRIDSLPGLMPIVQSLDSLTGTTIHLEFTARLDDRFRLSNMEASGQIFGIDGSFYATVDRARGLVGMISVPDRGIEHPVNMPSFLAGDGDSAAGIDLAHALPPGLSPGDTFSTEVIAVNPFPPGLDRRTVVYHVVGTEPDPTAPDGPPLNRIEIMDGAVVMGQLTADTRGVVRHTGHASSGLQLALRSAFYNGGKYWPPNEAVTNLDGDDQATE
ncbi:MAG: hypothetical protein PF961_13355 [Planctomycetota bacterium]|jgi:hypothetical protein|nr:hypothetical protein [Planctomycetota bacterium]